MADKKTYKVRAMSADQTVFEIVEGVQTKDDAIMVAKAKIRERCGTEFVYLAAFTAWEHK